MDACRVCLQSAQRVRLTRRDLSTFYAVCAMCPVDTERERYIVWVCAYCWARVSQCLQFVELVRRNEILLVNDTGYVPIKSEDFHRYSTVCQDNIAICEAPECLNTNGTIFCHFEEHKDSAQRTDSVFLAEPVCELDIDIKPKVEADSFVDCDPIKEESVPIQDIFYDKAEYSPVEPNPSDVDKQLKPIHENVDMQHPAYVVLPHVQTDYQMLHHKQCIQQYQMLQHKQYVQQQYMAVRQKNKKNTMQKHLQEYKPMDQLNAIIDQLGQQANNNKKQVHQTHQEMHQTHQQMHQTNQEVHQTHQQMHQTNQEMHQTKQEMQYTNQEMHQVNIKEESVYNRGLPFMKIAPKPTPFVISIGPTLADTPQTLNTVNENHNTGVFLEGMPPAENANTMPFKHPPSNTKLRAPPRMSEADRDKELGRELVELTLEQQKEEIESKKRSAKYIAKKHKCDKCGAAFHDEEVYIAHVGSRHHESAGAHECTMCGYRYKTAHLLSIHMADHARRWRCMRCSLVMRKSIWRTHHDRCAPHNVDSQYPCGICGKMYKTEYRLKKHTWVRHKTERQTIICDICKKTFLSKTILRDHIRMHMNVRPYKCDTCGKTFTSHTLLKCHMRKHEGPTEPREERYCVECDKYFKTSSNLASHLASNRKHVSIEMSKCSICSEKFTIKSSLDYHMKAVHLNVRDFPCDKCDKSYCSERVLRAHVRRKHSQTERKRNHPCGICGSNFYNPKTLKDHTVAVHERRRPYECEICGEKFGFSAALYTHRRLKHKIKGRPTLTQIERAE